MTTIIDRTPTQPLKPSSYRVKECLADILRIELGLSLARQLCNHLEDNIIGGFKLDIVSVNLYGTVSVHCHCDPTIQQRICQVLADLPQLHVGNGFFQLGRNSEPRVKLYFR